MFTIDSVYIIYMYMYINYVEIEEEEGPIFNKKVFMFYGFEEEHEKELGQYIEEKGGEHVKLHSRWCCSYNVSRISKNVLILGRTHCFTPLSFTGTILKATSRGIPDYAVVPIDGFPVDRTVNEIVTNAWLVRQ